MIGEIDPALERVRRAHKSDLEELIDKADIVTFAQSCGMQMSPYQIDAMTDKAKRKIYLWGRQTGKTTTAAVEALHIALFNPKATVVIVSPTLEQSHELMNEINARLIRYSTKYPESKTVLLAAKSTKEFKFQNGGRILCRPASSSIRGYHANFIIVDEAAKVEDVTIEQEITPLMATTGGSILMISTPNAIGTAFHKACNLPTVWTLHGPVKSEECPRVSKEFLDMEKEWMPLDYYKQEYEAIWMSSLSNVFPQPIIDACVMKKPPWLPKFGNVIGVDLAKTNDFTVFTVLNQYGEVLHLAEYQRIPYPDIIQHLNVLAKEFDVKRMMVDKTGIGEPIVDYIRRSGYKGSVEAVALSLKSKTDIINNLVAAFEHKRILIPAKTQHLEARKLYSQLLMYRYEKMEVSGVIRTTAPAGQHDDYVISLAMAAWLLRPAGRIQLVKGLEGLI